jgi:hypothetical protein
MCHRVKFCNHQWPWRTKLLKSLYPSAHVLKFVEILMFLGLNQTNCTKADLRMPAKNDFIYNTSVNLSCSVFMHELFVGNDENERECLNLL